MVKNKKSKGGGGGGPSPKAWKPVQMEGSLKAKGFQEGLLGIEVTNDYSLVGKSNKNLQVDSSNNSNNNKKRKRVDEDGSGLNPTGSKKKKKRNYRKPRKSKKKIEEEQRALSAGPADDAEKTAFKAKRPKKNAAKRPKKNAAKNKTEEKGAENDKDVSLDMNKMVMWSDLCLHESLLLALQTQGFECPTPIQRALLPHALQGKLDILGAAETGSGKTLAFGLPMLDGILKDMEREKKETEEKDDDDEAMSAGDADTSGQETGENEESEDEEDSEDEEEIERELIDDSDFEDMSDSEAQIGCVKVVNDVSFDFEEEDGNPPEMYMPPMEILENWGDNDKEEEPLEMPKKPLRGLILTPTRELAIQIKNHLEAAAKFTNIKIAVVVGGMAPQKQIRMLNYGPEIVVATPGRLWDLVQDGNPHLSQIKHIKYLAIDETDRMVEKGHFEELHQLLELINANESLKAKRQTFVFSATLALVHEAPKHILQSMGKKKAKGSAPMKKLTAKEKLNQVMSMIGVKEKHKLVDLTQKVGTAQTLTESRIHCDITEKDFYLYYFTQMHPGRTLVFCNSIDCVRRLVNLFGLFQMSSYGLHANMQQKQRLKSLERFTSNPLAVLIATDVAARGLDIPNVEHVVHYQVPKTSESYIHRSGRTARATKEGLSVMLIEPQENLSYKKICRTLGRSEDIPTFPVDSDMFVSVKKRVQVARELDKLKLELRKEDASKSWWKKAAEEADLALSDLDDSDNEAMDDETRIPTKIRAQKRDKIAAKTAELNSLLAVPLIGQGFSGKYPTKSGKLEMPKEFLMGSQTKSAIDTMKKDAELTKKILKGTSQKKKKKNFPKKKKKGKTAAGAN